MRVDGIDTETGKHRPRQIGTFPSQRAARSAAASATAEGETHTERDTMGRLVDRWVAARTDVGEATRAQLDIALDGFRTPRPVTLNTAPMTYDELIAATVTDSP